MFRFAPLIPLLALVGCAGSVSVEELDPFGGAASAVWFHWDDSNYDSLVLSNVPDLCARWKAFDQADDDLEDALEDLDWTDDDYCEEATEPTLAYARAGEALYHDGAHYLELVVLNADGSEPEEDTYEVGDAKNALTGSISYFGDTSFTAILEEWDQDEDVVDGCGLSANDLESDVDTWYLEDGELEIGRVADERAASGRLEGELVDAGGGDEGEITASFSASWCEIDR